MHHEVGTKFTYNNISIPLSRYSSSRKTPPTLTPATQWKRAHVLTNSDSMFLFDIIQAMFFTTFEPPVLIVATVYKYAKNDSGTPLDRSLGCQRSPVCVGVGMYLHPKICGRTRRD